MGQPVSKPTKTEKISNGSRNNIKSTYNELLEWNQKELQHWLDQTPFTVEDIRKYYNNNKNNDALDESQDTTQYYFSSDGESTTEEAQLAIRLLTLSPPLAKLRFRMVPANISESSFWEAVFALLKERVFYHQGLEAEENCSSSQNNNGHHYKDDSALRMTLASKNREIASLQRQVKELQQKRLQQQHKAKDNIQEEPTPLQQKKHKGKWVMNQDSIDFLNYPAEVKRNMRQEKQRRLQQIQNEMKFIIDSDHEKDSHGHWNCCGNTEYQAPCAKS